MSDINTVKHYWARHSMITPLGKKLTLGWSCPFCHQVVGEPYPYCPYCSERLLDPDNEDNAT